MEKINEANTTSSAPTLPARSVNAPAPQAHDDAARRRVSSWLMPIQCSSLAEPALQTHSKSIGLIPGYTHTHHMASIPTRLDALPQHMAHRIPVQRLHHRHSFPRDTLR
jgi:hypothetical protein